MTTDDRSKVQKRGTKAGSSANNEEEAETDESVESTESDASAVAEANSSAGRAIQHARSWLAGATGELGWSWPDTVVRNLANSLEFAEHAMTTKRRHQSVSSQRREERAQARRLLREWSETDDDSHGLDATGALFLLLTVMGLLVCPVVSMAKCPSTLSLNAFTGPLKFKYHISLVVNAASIGTGLAIVAYVLLLPCLRSAFPVVETPTIGYSSHLLNEMHFTTGGVMAYKCIGQHQCLKRKYTEAQTPEA